MDPELLKKLLAEGKEQEAQQLLEDYLADDVSPRERGEALLAMAATYMDAENAIHEAHVRVLKNALAELKDLEKDYHETVDQLTLIKARKTIDQG